MSQESILPYDASDPEQVAKRVKTSKTRELSVADGLKDCLKTKQGRDFVWDILSVTGVFRSSFTGNAVTFFNEGRRDVGLQLLARITKLCPERLTEMMREGQQNE